MPTHLPGVVSAITACALTLVLTSGNVAPTPSTSTVEYSLVRSACTSQPVSSALTGIATACADATGNPQSYQNVSKIVVLDVTPASGSPQIGPVSAGGEQTLSGVIGQRVASLLGRPSRGTELFPGQTIDITESPSIDMVKIEINLVATSGFYTASSLANSVLKLVGDRGLNDLVGAVQSCVGDVATLLNNPSDPQGKQTTVTDAIVKALIAKKFCDDLVDKVRKKVKELRADKEANADHQRVQNDLVDNVRQYEQQMKTEYDRVVEGPREAERAQEIARRQEAERRWEIDQGKVRKLQQREERFYRLIP